MMDPSAAHFLVAREAYEATRESTDPFTVFTRVFAAAVAIYLAYFFAGLIVKKLGVE